MIKNERQLTLRKKQLEEFISYLEKIDKEPESQQNEFEKEALRVQIESLEKEITEYENLWSSGRPIETIVRISDIPYAIIRARIAQGMSQKELAEKMGLKEQQIQRYEATNYETASLARINEFVNFFNIELQEQSSFGIPILSFEEFIKRIRKAGIDKKFIEDRLLSPKAKSLIENKRLDRTGKKRIEIFDHIGNIYGWNYKQIATSPHLSINPNLLGEIKFKVPRNASKDKVYAFTMYSNYIGNLVKKATEHLPRSRLPNNPFIIRREIIHKYGSITIESALRYIWELGTPVIVLNDSGGFHGLYLNKDGRIVIVINQLTDSPAIWLFSLFHEFSHAIDHQDEKKNQVIEIEDIIGLSDLSDIDIAEENRASNFAGAVLLGKVVDDIVNTCIEKSEGLVPRLKKVVQEVAKKENVPVDVLANCVAFRVSQYGGNFWGSAQNLQRREENIQKIARDVLLDYVDLSQISGLDLDLLRRSIIN